MKTAGYSVSNRCSSKYLNEEINTLTLKKNANFKIALVYPNSYFLGMSSLGVHTIYGLFNSRADTLCERFFFDQRNKNILSIESGRILQEYDVIAFSISYEMDFFNVIDILCSAGLAAEKDKRPAMPLIICGGMVNSFNALPLSRWVDALFIGEADESLNEFMDELSGSGNINTLKKKNDFLLRASNIKGVCVPGISEIEQAEPRYLTQVDKYPSSTKIITPDTEFSNTFLVEISRGCPWRCNFCVTAAVSGKFRPRKFEVLEQEIEKGLRYTSKIGLVSAAVTEYPELERLIDLLEYKGAKISVSSLRVEAVTEKLLKALADSGQMTVTFAPEAGSDLLRGKINKKITNEEIVRAAVLARKSGIKKIKLYFMIGLPGEGDEDIKALVELSRQVRRILPVKVNVGIFVPKPKTAFALEQMPSNTILSSRLRLIKQILMPEKGISVSFPQIREAVTESILAYADKNFFNKYLPAA